MEDELGLLGVSKMAGCRMNAKYAWDVVDFRQNGGSKGQYQRRFDQIYVKQAMQWILLLKHLRR
jgi:hypothetical protein